MTDEREYIYVMGLKRASKWALGVRGKPLLIGGAGCEIQANRGKKG